MRIKNLENMRTCGIYNPLNWRKNWKPTKTQEKELNLMLTYNESSMYIFSEVSVSYKHRPHPELKDKYFVCRQQ